MAYTVCHAPLKLQVCHALLELQCMLCASRNISKMLPEIYTMETCDILQSMIHSQIF